MTYSDLVAFAKREGVRIRVLSDHENAGVEGHPIALGLFVRWLGRGNDAGELDSQRERPAGADVRQEA